MNLSVYGGRLCTVPQLTLIQLDGKSICVCKFVIAVCDGLVDYSDAQNYDEGKVDFFECVAFEGAARMINSNFVKGSKIVCRGKMKNHRFEDANKTPHFTNIFLTEYVEFGDTEAVVSKFANKRKPLEMSIIADLKELDQLFERVCDNGFLCIDENDYYNIAMANM